MTLPAHVAAALADPAALPDLLREATAAWEDAERLGSSPRVLRGLGSLAGQAAVGVLRLGLLEGRVHVALGGGPGLVARAGATRADALTWIEAWYLARIVDLPDIRAELAALRPHLPGPEWAVAWAGVLAALDELLDDGAPPADAGWRLGAAERLVPGDTPERALLPLAAALLTGDDADPVPGAGRGARAFTAITRRRPA